MSTPISHRDLLDVLVEDHREVEYLFAQLEGGTPDHEQRRRVADVVIAELVRHTVAEEEYLYPAAREVLPDGDQVADRGIAEHAEAERAMRGLEALAGDDPRFDEQLGTLMTLIRRHYEMEEDTLFPRVRAALPDKQLQLLGGQAEMAKSTAPTRPHPAVPDTPPWNTVLAPGAGLVDRVRDAISGRPTRPRDL